MTRMSCLFAVLLTVCMVLAPLAACAQESVEPSGFPGLETAGGDTFAPVLAPTAGAGMAKIKVPWHRQSPSSEKIVERLNAALQDKGVNIEFVIQSDSSPADNNGSYVQLVKNELNSGKPSADAYLVYRNNIDYFKANAQLMDVLPLLKTAAPAYYERYREIFDNGDFIGLPVGMNGYSYRVQPALMLREDAEREFQPSITTLAEMLTFIDDNIVTAKRNWSMLAEPFLLVQLWAYEKGFYPLGSVVSDGQFVARVDDLKCKPALLEGIPGFYEFVDQLLALYTAKALVIPTNPDAKREPVGVIRNLGDYALPDASNAYDWVDGRFTAHVFYDGKPSFYLEQSGFNGALLLPVGCAMPADIIKFAEWMYGSQDNYNAVIYGEAGVDYTLSNDRLTLLAEGKPIVSRPVSAVNSIFMLWPGAALLGSTDYHLLPQSAPVNYEELIDDGRGEQVRLPFEGLLASADDSSRKLLTPTKDMRQIMDQRNNCIFSIVYSMYRGSYSSYKTSLEALDNDWLLGEYENLINKFMNAVKK